jgi:DNA-binding NarL/FixJ family response regulator
MTVNGTKHIFIVDDNEIYSMMLDYILSKNNNYKFLSFKSGEECLKNLYLNPEIVILDYEMPGLNGYETLLEIKKHSLHIHVVILTRHEDEELKQKLLLAGADDYILKQGNGEKQVIEKIEEILSTEEFEESNAWGMKNAILYFILIVVLLTMIYFYRK